MIFSSGVLNYVITFSVIPIGFEPDVPQVRNHQHELQSSYDDLGKLAAERKQRLEESLQLHSFYRDAEEEDLWLSEKEYFVSSTEYGKDVPTTILLLKKHKVCLQIGYSIIC